MMKILKRLFFGGLALGIIMILVLPMLHNNCKGNTDETIFDVIIVLGNPATENCLPAPMMQARIDKGLELFKLGYSHRIIFTGSSVANNCNEAEVMSNYAKANGIPDSCIIEEGRAENTYQNAFYSVQQMNDHNLKSAAVVTSSFHIQRACNIFSNYEIKYSMFPVSSPAKLSKYQLFRWKLRERIILSYHGLFGYSKKFGLKKNIVEQAI